MKKEKADFSKQDKYNINVKINEKLNKNRPNTKELANIFLVKPKNTPDSEEFKYLGTDYSETINFQYELKGTNKEVGENWSDFVYYKDSKLAIDVSGSKEMQVQIRKQFDNNIKKFKTNKIDISFTDSDLHLALGHATILNPSIDNKGYFHGILFDKYDFDPIYKTAYKNPIIYAANNYFWYMQEKDRSRNFYILAPVTFKW